MSTYGMLEVLEVDNVNPELLKAHKPMQGKVSENYKNKYCLDFFDLFIHMIYVYKKY